MLFLFLNEWCTAHLFWLAWCNPTIPRAVLVWLDKRLLLIYSSANTSLNKTDWSIGKQIRLQIVCSWLIWARSSAGCWSRWAPVWSHRFRLVSEATLLTRTEWPAVSACLSAVPEDCCPGLTLTLWFTKRVKSRFMIHTAKWFTSVYISQYGGRFLVVARHFLARFSFSLG